MTKTCFCMLVIGVITVQRHWLAHNVGIATILLRHWKFTFPWDSPWNKFHLMKIGHLQLCLPPLARTALLCDLQAEHLCLPTFWNWSPQQIHRIWPELAPSRWHHAPEHLSSKTTVFWCLPSLYLYDTEHLLATISMYGKSLVHAKWALDNSHMSANIDNIVFPELA